MNHHSSDRGKSFNPLTLGLYNWLDGPVWPFFVLTRDLDLWLRGFVWVGSVERRVEALSYLRWLMLRTGFWRVVESKIYFNSRVTDPRTRVNKVFTTLCLCRITESQDSPSVVRCGSACLSVQCPKVMNRHTRTYTRISKDSEQKVRCFAHRSAME